MQPLFIKSTTNALIVPEQPTHFFILAKGNNAGKPSLTHWANAFTAIAPTQEMRDFYYWLTFGLYKAKAFKIHHRGSVIPFINIGEVKKLIEPAAIAIYPQWQDYKSLLTHFELLEQRKNNLAQILKSTATLQEMLIRNYFLQQGL
ncbi:DUF6943 family protein [Parasediminibacterium paludis]|uniref:DUF6943 family protein n=1 Tax=Parasediminibacterium paludis TaxID=908966 RepID=A0ABV8PVN7_9BACT